MTPVMGRRTLFNNWRRIRRQGTRLFGDGFLCGFLLPWRFRHGKARLWIEPVPGWLRRPPETRTAKPRAVSSLPGTGARLGRLGVRSRHVRSHALLGRGPAGLG